MHPLLVDILLPRAILFMVLMGFVLIRWRHRRPAGKRQATADARERWLTRVVVISWLLPSWLWLGTPFAGFADLPVPWTVRITGAGVGLGGLALLWWVHRTLGENFSPWLELRTEHTLVDHGPYARIRHPMYTAGFVLTLSFGLISGNVLLATVPALGLVPLVAVRVPDEEQMMRERFGAAYDAYCARTGRLLPRP